jgi:prepilin-type processing-associated H-X9-DG protein
MSKGFGVAILLVTIALVALVSIPFRAGHYDYKSPCLSNVKQTGTAFWMYAGDYDDRLPLAANWVDVLEPYSKNSIVKCSSVGPGQYGFAFNRFLSGVDTKKEVDSELQPMAYDCRELAKNVSEYLPLFDYERHNGTANVVFLDGHGRTFKVAEPK